MANTERPHLRESFLSPWCWPLCCGGVPLFGVLKGLLCAVLCVPFLTLSCVLMTLAKIPQNLFYAYKALIFTKKLGPHLKTVIALLLWFPFVLILPAVLICSFIFSLGYCLVMGVYMTFMIEKNFWYGGIPEIFTSCFYEYPKSYWTYWGDDYYKMTQEFEDHKLAEGEEPFDVPIYWVPIGLFYALVGVLVDMPAAAIIGGIKWLPGTLKLYRMMWSAYFDAGLCIMTALVVFFIVANVLLPVVTLGAYLIFILVGAFFGLTAVGAAYKRGLKAGFERVVHSIYEMDEVTNKAIFKADSCLPCLKCGEDFC